MSTSVLERPTATAAHSAGAGNDPAQAHPVLQQKVPRRRGNFGLNTSRLLKVRLICFAVLALPLLLLALLAVKFISMPLTQAWHNQAYSEGNYSQASDRLGPVRFANWFEPYLPHLSHGTDLLQQGENAAAEEELRIALDRWEQGYDLNQPQHAQCKILNNLAISIERQADQMQDPAARAERLYEAEELMQPCAGGGGGGQGEGEGEGGGEGEGESESSEGSGNEDSETTKENSDRIQEKRREADEEAGNDPGDRATEQGEEQGGPGGDDGNSAPMEPGDPRRTDPDGEEDKKEEAPQDGGGEDNDPKEDELNQRNRDAQGGDGEEEGGSNSNPERPW